MSAGTDPEHRRLGAAAFLRWRVFEWLAATGKRGNDLTDAALNPVTHFKSQLGGELVTNFVLESPGSMRYRTVTGLRAVTGSCGELRAAPGGGSRPPRPRDPYHQRSPAGRGAGGGWRGVRVWIARHPDGAVL